MKKSKYGEKLERIENILLIFLTLVMVGLCAAASFAGERFSDKNLPVFPESEQRLLSSFAKEELSTGESVLAPCFAGAFSNGVMNAADAGENYASDIRRCFVRVLEHASGGTTKRIAFSDKERKESYLENLYASAKDGFYLRFPDSIHYSLLCTLLSGSFGEEDENGDFEIAEMFLLRGSDGESSVIAVDRHGEVLKIFPSKNIPFNSELLAAYTAVEKNSFVFVKSEEEEPSYFPVLRHSAELYSLRAVPFAETVDFSLSSGKIGKYVSALGVNIDNSRSYESYDGSLIFVENAGQLKITRDGCFEYEPGGNGTSADYYLDYENEYEDDASALVAAGASLIGRINKLTEDSTCSLGLAGASVRDGKLMLTFKYSALGIPVESGEDYDALLVFSSRNLVYACVKVMTLERAEKVTLPMTGYSAFRLTDFRPDSKAVFFGPEYASADGGKTYAPQWTLRSEKEARS